MVLQQTEAIASSRVGNMQAGANEFLSNQEPVSTQITPVTDTEGRNLPPLLKSDDITRLVQGSVLFWYLWNVTERGNVSKSTIWLELWAFWPRTPHSSGREVTGQKESCVSFCSCVRFSPFPNDQWFCSINYMAGCIVSHVILHIRFYLMERISNA